MGIINSLFAAALLSGTALLAAPQTLPKLRPSGTQFVFIGDAWNKADELGHGFCSRNFLLGAYEWTVRDWKEKILDLVACEVDSDNEDPNLRVADPHHLWNKKMARWITRKGRGTLEEPYVYSISHPGKDENLPITNVSLFDIFRACNVIQQIKERGDALGLREKSIEEIVQYLKDHKISLIEKGHSFDEITEWGGAYIITTDSEGKQNAQRAVGCCFYIPTQDEWIKAAYYTPHYNPNKIGDTNAPAGYYLYPTQHDINPRNKWDTCLENRANYIADYHSWLFEPVHELFPVNYCGWFDPEEQAQGTRSYYGCFDMAGNINEWTTTMIEVQGYSLTEMPYEGWGPFTPKDENIFYPVRGGDYESQYYMELGVDNYLTRTCIPEILAPSSRSDMIGFRMAAAEGSMAPMGKGFMETAHPNRWWDTLTTGQQEMIESVEFAALSIVGNVGAVAGTRAVGFIAEDIINEGLIGSKATTKIVLKEGAPLEIEKAKQAATEGGGEGGAKAQREVIKEDAATQTINAIDPGVVVGPIDEENGGSSMSIQTPLNGSTYSARPVEINYGPLEDDCTSLDEEGTDGGTQFSKNNSSNSLKDYQGKEPSANVDDLNGSILTSTPLDVSSASEEPIEPNYPPENFENDLELTEERHDITRNSSSKTLNHQEGERIHENIMKDPQRENVEEESEYGSQSNSEEVETIPLSSSRNSSCNSLSDEQEEGDFVLINTFKLNHLPIW